VVGQISLFVLSCSGGSSNPKSCARKRLRITRKGRDSHPRHNPFGNYRFTLLCTVCFGTLLLSLGCKNRTDQPPVIKYKPLPRQAPVPLGVATIEKFVDWVSTMPSSQVPDVQHQIAKAASDPALVDAVASKLSFKAPGSYGRQLIYLSILGETKSPRAISPLQLWLNSSDCPVFEEQRVKPPVGPGHTSYFDGCAGLKSAAVNMLGYINTPASLGLVLQAVRDHPSRAVRLSAMNAYMFNNNDTPQALAQVLRVARRDEVKLVGLPRLAPQFSMKKFNERVTQFYQEHPEERSQPVPAPVEPKPTKTGIPPHTQNPKPTQPRAAAE
jgi:hypothetical protein